MKRRFLMSVALVCAFAAHVYGDECALQIRDGSAAQDLSRILHCFDQRIKNSEVEISDLKRRLEGGRTTVNPAEFDAGTFAASVRGASRQGEYIHLGVAIRNKTTEEMLLAINYYARPVLIDEDKGISISDPGIDGIAVGGPEDKDISRRTPILPNAVMNFSLKFRSGESKGRIFSLTIHFISFNDQQAKKVTVPLGVTLKGN